MGSFFSELYISYKQIYGHVLALIALIVSVASFVWVPTQAVEVKWVVLGGCMALVVLAVLVDLCFRALTAATRGLPNVIAATSLTWNQTEFPLLLLAPSSLFGHGMVVSVYQQQREFEVFVGIGSVHNIQEDGNIQVLIRQPVAEKADLWDMIAKGKTTPESLIVKPSGPYEQLQNGENNYV